MTTQSDNWLAEQKTIEIVYTENWVKKTETYCGERTVEAIRKRLNKIRQGGEVDAHVYVNGEYCWGF